MLSFLDTPSFVQPVRTHFNPSRHQSLLLAVCVSTVWKEVRDDANKDVDWVLIGYDGNSKTDMTVLEKGNGSVEGVSAKLPPGVPVFGGIRLSKKDRFVQFLYIDEDCPAMKRGRTLMYKNGMFECRKRVVLFLCWCEELVVSIQNDKRLRMMNSLTSSTVALILPVLSFVY